MWADLLQWIRQYIGVNRSIHLMYSRNYSLHNSDMTEKNVKCSSFLHTPCVYFPYHGSLICCDLLSVFDIVVWHCEILIVIAGIIHWRIPMISYPIWKLWISYTMNWSTTQLQISKHITVWKLVGCIFLGKSDSNCHYQVGNGTGIADRSEKNDTFCESRTILFMAFRNFRPFPPLHMNMAANVIFMLIWLKCLWQRLIISRCA